MRRPGKGEGKAKTTKPAQVVAKKPAVTEVRAKVLIADLRKERAMGQPQPAVRAKRKGPERSGPSHFEAGGTWGASGPLLPLLVH